MDAINLLLDQQWYECPKVFPLFLFCEILKWSPSIWRALLMCEIYLSLFPIASISGKLLETNFRTGAGGGEGGEGLVFLRVTLPGCAMWFPVFRYEITQRKWERSWEVQIQNWHKIQADLWKLLVDEAEGWTGAREPTELRAKSRKRYSFAKGI